jgi:hypothetical protein
MIDYMKVGSSTSSKSTSKTARKAAVGGSSAGFAAIYAQEVSSAEAAGMVDTVSAVDGVMSILATQTVGDSTEERARNRRALEKGNQLLDKLEEVRTELLTGSVSKQDLYMVSKMANETRDAAADPRLAEILAEIELRAEVEIAKLTSR